MQKKLIALAVAGLGLNSAAFAQTNVTIYGVMDLSVESVKASGSVAGTDNAATTRISSNSSLIGVKGAEDLGNGLSAIFQIEANLAPDTGAGVFTGSTRDTYVGLKSTDWGTIKAGTLTGPTRALAATVEFSPGWTTNAITSATTGVADSDNRMTNAVLYSTNGLLDGALTLQAGYSAGARTAVETNPAGGSEQKNVTAGATYNQGPLYVAYAYLRENNLATITSDKLTFHVVGAKYTFPSDTTVSALYNRATTDLTGGDTKRKAWMLGVNQAFGGVHNVWLQYAKRNDSDGSLAVADDGAKQFTLGYSYAFSKRTMLHAYYTKLTNQSGSASDLAVNGVGNTDPSGIELGEDPSSLGLGLRHTF